jgi:hypothetical protein
MIRFRFSTGENNGNHERFLNNGGPAIRLQLINGDAMPTITTQRPATMQEMQDEIDRLRAGYAALYDREALLCALLVWALYHHQGGSSEVGQPIRKALGLGPHDRIGEEMLVGAKRVVAELQSNAEVSSAND